MARVMENHSKSLLPIPDVTSTTTRGFATQVRKFQVFGATLPTSTWRRATPMRQCEKSDGVHMTPLSANISPKWGHDVREECGLIACGRGLAPLGSSAPSWDYGDGGVTACRRYPPCCTKGGRGQLPVRSECWRRKGARGDREALGSKSTCHADSKRNFHSYAGLHPRSSFFTRTSDDVGLYWREH